MSRRRWIVLVVSLAVLGAAVAVVVAYRQRIAPPYPPVAGEAYPIALDAHGCPVPPVGPRFVDSPGPLVPPAPVAALLCSLPVEGFPRADGEPTVPLKRQLTAAQAAEFAAFLNRLPDRNAAWRDWQRRHSGLWPDRAPSEDQQTCPQLGYPYDYMYLLTYSDRAPVALVSTCGTGGLTTGARTRLDVDRPHVLDEFVRLLGT